MSSGKYQQEVEQHAQAEMVRLTGAPAVCARGRWACDLPCPPEHRWLVTHWLGQLDRYVRHPHHKPSITGAGAPGMEHG